MKAKTYTADLDPNDCGLMAFTITYSGNENDDQPWQIDCDAVSDTHHTLDELLFWNLIMGERFISEDLRQKINNEWAMLATPATTEDK